MHFDFTTDDVPLMIADAAQSCLDDYDDDVPLYERVDNAVESYTMYYRDQLMLIAYYGLIHESFIGQVDFEDSTCSQFEDDVYEAAKKFFEDEGRKVPE